MKLKMQKNTHPGRTSTGRLREDIMWQSSNRVQRSSRSYEVGEITKTSASLRFGSRDTRGSRL